MVKRFQFSSFRNLVSCIVVGNRPIQFKRTSHRVRHLLYALFAAVMILLPSTSFCYENPLLGPINDPDCVLIDGTYHLIEPGGHAGAGYFNYRTSRDLVHWSKPVRILQQQPGHQLWQGFFYKDTDGKLYLYYAVLDEMHYKSVHVAVAPAFTGPYTDLGEVASNAIDPTLFRDDDGSLWLYFKNDRPGYKSIWAQRMATPSTVAVPATEILRPMPKTFEDNGYVSVEGPTVIKRAGKYFLLYTGGPFGGKSYAVGYAVAQHPEGPFVRGPNNPILSNTKSSNVYSPGVPDVVLDGAGKSWMVYRQRQTAERRSPRMLTLDPLDDSRAAEGILDAKATSGTSVPDPVPLP